MRSNRVRLIGGVYCLLVLAFSPVTSLARQNRSSQPAVPAEPIAAILEAFRSHRIVALGEGSHGNEQGHLFRLSLVRDPRFAAAVNDIVVEFGSARYQDLMDRFVRGQDVDTGALRHVWEDTTQPHGVWDSPIYEEFFRAVRAVNIALPAERKLRVLLGDPPVDWSTVQSSVDLGKWGDRDPHAADVIRREVLAKQRRALVIYGDAHLRGDLSLIKLVEDSTNTDVFTVVTNTAADLTTLQADVASWPVPSFTMLRGTILGSAGRPFYQDKVPSETTSASRLEDHFDALLYLGPPSAITISEVSPTRCSDPGYFEMRMQRMAVLPPGPIVQSLVDRLKQLCDAVPRP
jgi:hypothetical protein